MWREHYLQVVYEDGIDVFFERVFAATAVTRIVIVTPWISTMEGQGAALQHLVEFVQLHSLQLVVVTRDPRMETYNHEAVQLLLENVAPKLTLYYNNSVHAKVYVCRCQPKGFALLSSANFTPHGKLTREVGLMVDGLGAGERVVEELELVGTDYIPGKAETKLSWAPWHGR